MKKELDGDMVEFDDGWFMTKKEYEKTIHLLTVLDQQMERLAKEGKLKNLRTVTVLDSCPDMTEEDIR